MKPFLAMRGPHAGLRISQVVADRREAVRKRRAKAETERMLRGFQEATTRLNRGMLDAMFPDPWYVRLWLFFGGRRS